MRVLAFGEILWDIINGEDHLGGAPFNFAAHAVQCGNQSFIVSRLGDDFRGLKAYNRCKQYGVDHSLVQWDHTHPTGVVEVTLEQGQPDYTIIKDVAFDYIEIDDKLESVAGEPFDLFYFGSLAQRNDRSAKTLQHILKTCKFEHIFYDVNLRKDGYSRSTIEKSLKSCTILKLNSDEVPVISAVLLDHDLDMYDFCKAVKHFYPQINITVITASEKGCYLFSNERLQYIPGRTVQVNDTVGAGDAFSAAFMHAICKGFSPEDAAAIANQIGAYVTTQRGAIPRYSTEIRKLLDMNSQPRNYATQIIL